MHLGNKYDDIAYVDIEEVTDLISEVLAACDKVLTFQPWYFFITFSTSPLKASFFDLPICKGRPRCKSQQNLFFLECLVVFILYFDGIEYFISKLVWRNLVLIYYVLFKQVIAHQICHMSENTRE